MSARVRLIAQTGTATQREYAFDRRTTCIVGRSPDCQIRILDAEANRTVSRYHCMIDINPPEIFVRDFGSLNGTYVNDEFIGKRGYHAPNGDETAAPVVQLTDGDEIRIWNLTLVVRVENADAPAAPATPNKDLDAFKKLLADGVDHADEFTVDGYTIGDELGRGGMGIAYRAIRLEDQQECVIKIIHPEKKGDKWLNDSFLREAQNTLAIRHKNIVTVRDWGWADSSFYLVTEFCDAGDLEQLFQKRGRLPVATAVTLVRHVLAGLEHAHQTKVPNVKLADGSIGTGTGLVHRDLSPENVLLHKHDGKLRAKIADFGLSKAFDLAGLTGFTMTGMQAGKPYCICRQQVLEYRDCLPEVDVWAAAACLYYLLTGSYPREFPTGCDVWSTVLNERPIPILDRRHDLPIRLAKLIDTALNDRGKLEFQSAAHFSKMLAHSLR